MRINRKRHKRSENDPKRPSSPPFWSGCFHGFLVESPNSVLDVTQFGFQVVAAFLLLQEGWILRSRGVLNICSSAVETCCFGAPTLFFSSYVLRRP